MYLEKHEGTRHSSRAIHSSTIQPMLTLATDGSKYVPLWLEKELLNAQT